MSIAQPRRTPRINRTATPLPVRQTSATRRSSNICARDPARSRVVWPLRSGRQPREEWLDLRSLRPPRRPADSRQSSSRPAHKCFVHGPRLPWSRRRMGVSRQQGERKHDALSVQVGVAAGAVGAPGLAAQQTTTGSIGGRVVDSQNLPVPGATVTVVSPQGDRTFTTDADGRFFAPYLTPGQYQIKVELSGFRQVDRKDIQLRLGQRDRSHASHDGW